MNPLNLIWILPLSGTLAGSIGFAFGVLLTFRKGGEGHE